MSEQERQAVDQFLADTLAAVSAGVDVDEAYAGLREGIQAIRKQLEALNGVNYKARTLKLKCPECAATAEFKAPWKPDELARAAAHTMKVNDELARLVQFAKGLPDSRPDAGGSNRDLLSLLTAEQFAMVQGWIVAAQGRG